MPTVYVASFSRGCIRPKIEGATCLNVTSCQPKNHPNRLAFSPLHLGPVIDSMDNLKFNTFEGWWQGQKRYPDLGHISDTNQSTEAFKRFRSQVATTTNPSQLRHPKGTKTREKIGTQVICGKQVTRYKRLVPQDAVYHGQIITGYINSRKMAYVPYYYNLIQDSSQLNYYKKIYSQGHDIVVYDLDGPKDNSGHHQVLPVTAKMLREKLNYTRDSFGHGYIVAAALLNITPSEICD